MDGLCAMGLIQISSSTKNQVQNNPFKNRLISWHESLIHALNRMLPVVLATDESTDKDNCEKNVYNCILKSPQIKLMLAAMKSGGWYAMTV